MGLMERGTGLIKMVWMKYREEWEPALINAWEWINHDDQRFFKNIAIVFSAILALTLAIIISFSLPEVMVLDLKFTESLVDQEKRSNLIIEHRKSLLQLFGGLIVILGIYVAWRRSAAHEKQANAQHESQITERYTRAVDQLGNKEKAIRLGGIYALERIAKDSPDDHPQIMELLTAFVREESPKIHYRTDEEKKETNGDSKEYMEELIKAESKYEHIIYAIAAIMTVIGRRKWRDKENVVLNLTHCNISRIKLIASNFQNIDFTGAQLQYAEFWAVNLQGAQLQEANLHGANLEGADLRGANLYRTELKGAWVDDNTKFSDCISIEIKWNEDGETGQIISFEIED